MKADFIRLNGTYQMKPAVFTSTTQADGAPHKSDYVTIVRIKFPEGRKRAWYFDAKGNAYRSEDLMPASVIEVEL